VPSGCLPGGFFILESNMLWWGYRKINLLFLSTVCGALTKLLTSLAIVTSEKEKTLLELQPSKVFYLLNYWQVGYYLPFLEPLCFCQSKPGSPVLSVIKGHSVRQANQGLVFAIGQSWPVHTFDV